MLKNMKDDYGFKWIDLFNSHRKPSNNNWYTTCTSCIAIGKECHHAYNKG